jgi:inorganic pyrophosphatase
MNASQLKYEVETKTHSNFFSRSSMKFFGDTMHNYGVCSNTVETWDGETVEVWELYRKHAVKHGLKDSAYFDKKTFQRVHPKR